MSIKRSPLLRPITQLLIIPALSLKPPSKEPLNTVTSRLNCRVRGAYERLTEVLKTVSCMLCPVETEVETLRSFRV